MPKKRYKQSTILPEIEDQINLMPEAKEHGFTYAANLALSRYFGLPTPDLPGKRISNAVESVDRSVRIDAGKRGAASRWKKQ